MAIAQAPGTTRLEEGLSEQTLLRVRRIKEYDFSLVREKALDEGWVKEKAVDKAIEEFRKYLILIALEHRGLAMCSRIVDQIWHSFILFTQEYESFCQDVFGHFLHHCPATKESPISPEARVHFLTAYQQTFGSLPRIWVKNQADSCEEKCTPTTNCQNPTCQTTYCKSSDSN